MARLKHLALVVAVRLVSLVRASYHAAGRALGAGSRPLVRGSGLLLRTLALPGYAAWQRGRLWLGRVDAATVNASRTTVNAAVLLAICLAAAASLTNQAQANLDRENLGRGAIIGSILAPSDQPLEEEVLEEGPTTPNEEARATAYLDPAALQAELQPANASSNSLVLSGSEDALLAYGLPPSGVRTRSSIETYAVETGDTMGSIARQFGLKVTTLLWANNLTERSLLRIGQTLTIPPANGIVYTAKKGDTLATIAKQYKVAVEQLEEFNRQGSGQLKVGSTVFVPGAQPAAAPARVTTPSRLPAQTRIAAIPAAAAPNNGTRLLWPTTSRRITQYFHYGHYALDIGTPKGQPIYASDDGVVVRAQWNNGYGYNVVIDHGGGLRTLYAHSSQLLVHAGDHVTRGQVIALVGSTGHSTGPHVHYEVTVGGVKQNPLSYTR